MSETQSLAFTYKYNDTGMVTEMVYPDGSVHRYEYDGALGRLEQIKAVTDTEKWLSEGGLPTGIIPFVTALEYTPSGVVTRMEYANRTVQTWEFDNRKRISRIQISNFREILEDFNYKLDGVGNILAINENEYGYDGFDRIIKDKTLLPGNLDKKKIVAKYFEPCQPYGYLMALFATEFYANANFVTCRGLISRIREFGGKNENNKY